MGFKKALEKRPVDDKKIDEMVDEIEYRLHQKGNCEISSKEIGGLVLEKLKTADDVAYLRFASVYKSFGSAESFKKEAEKLSQN
ncbi:MAG: Transcriptional repressor NrdR [Candidatus Moranbacteria bacterium GW2011_GWF1_44_4]|nr:MAG: Transcriptional repressor NrdR [Candidatus Moranbacteria bacterium GW2011_GWF1_44_4]